MYYQSYCINFIILVCVCLPLPAGSDTVKDTLVDDEDLNVGEARTGMFNHNYSCWAHLAYMVDAYYYV